MVPVFNEIESLPHFYSRISEVETRLKGGIEMEFLFVDDGSNDGSLEWLINLSKTDPRVRVIKLSRNFGSYVALTAGLANAAGDVAVMLSADLQDPPELIPDLLEKWRQGSEVVWAVRKSRSHDPTFRRIAATVFYGVFRRIAFPNYPPKGYDFCLVDRSVIEAVTHGQERNTSIFALIVWAGFETSSISYDRGDRVAGTTHWNVRKMAQLAIDAIISFSSLPVRLALWAATCVGIALFCYMGWVLYGSMTGKFSFPPGWPSLMTVVLLTSGLQLTILAVLGEYLWRTLDHARGRPVYVVSRKYGYGLNASREASPPRSSSVP